MYQTYSMTINCKGNLIDLQCPKVMGILNLTPDSFYDGGRYGDTSAILAQVEKMVQEGVDFIDLGAYSSRPGAAHVPEEMELERIVPVVTLLQKEFPELLLSVDTFRSKVAAECLENGAALVNDISAGSMDAQMFTTMAKYGAPYIMMHMRGTPQNMQQQTNYTDLLVEICHYFSQKVALATAAGINDIILDPGFGFAKTLNQNYELLRKLALFQTFNLPILVGLSRKSMIYKLLETGPQQALNGTTALNMYALQQGAHILRVHDVREAKECVQLAQELKQGNS